MPGLLVFRGVDMLEVALQLMGVVMAKNPQLVAQLQNRAFMVKEIGKVRFRGMVRPGDKLVFETGTDVEVVDLRGILRIDSGKMVGRVGEDIKCEIEYLTIIGIRKESLRIIP
jgi:3-hydroxymyristoyl/3-hydroxydecanoyl-(acyl carrier protein) dehydratase